MDEFREEEAVIQPAEWPVDLSREEYIEFYLLLNKISGPLRFNKMQFIITLVFFAIIVSVCIYNWIVQSVFDWLTLVVSGALFAMSFGLWIFAPRRARNLAGKAYDDTVVGGYRYSGILRVRDDRIEKENTQGLNTVLLDNRTMFIETPTMLVFLTAARRSIVLPARYLTDEAATALRQAADKLPYRNRRFIGRVHPQGETPVATPAVEDTVLWEATIRYEVDELADLLRHTVKTNFSHRLPVHGVMSLLVALFFASDRESMPTAIIAFLLTFAFILLMNLIFPLRNAKAQAAMADAAARTTEVKFTARGIWLNNPNGNFVVIPWTEVEHIIDRDGYVEITRGPQSIRIPKRYILSLSDFDTLVTTQWKKTDSK